MNMFTVGFVTGTLLPTLLFALTLRLYIKQNNEEGRDKEMSSLEVAKHVFIALLISAGIIGAWVIAGCFLWMVYYPVLTGTLFTDVPFGIVILTSFIFLMIVYVSVPVLTFIGFMKERYSH